MKKKRLAIQAAKRRKKARYQEELKKLKLVTFLNNKPSAELLAEYRLAKLNLLKTYYPEKYGYPKL